MKTRALLISAFLLSACAAPALTDSQIDAKLKQATAEAIGGAKLATIRISSPERFPAKWQWKASVNDKSFACDADDHMRLPSCTQINIASPT